MKARFSFLPTPRILLILTFTIFYACKENNTPPPFAFEADPEGNWIFGDLHVHATGASNDTGGDSFPEDIKSIALERGISFIVLTDHSNSTGSDPSTTKEDPALFNMGPEFPYWDLAANLSDDQFLMICGNELSPVADESLGEPRGHIGCLPRVLEGFDTETAFIDRPKGAVTGGEALQQATDRGCYTIVNHPYGILPWIRYDWTSLEYNAIEVWNGTIGFDGADRAAYDIWICDLLAGRNVSAIGASDCHRTFTEAPGSGVDPALGFPMTGVFAEGFNWPSIIQALDNGQTMIVEGESRLQIDGYDIEGARNETNAMHYIRVRGKADATLENAVLQIRLYQNCADPRPSSEFPELTFVTLHEENIDAGMEFDMHIIPEIESGVYVSTLIGEDVHFAALSRAIVID